MRKKMHAEKNFGKNLYFKKTQSDFIPKHARCSKKNNL